MSSSTPGPPQHSGLIGDLIALAALAAVWARQDADKLASSFAQVLSGMLDLAGVLIRLQPQAGAAQTAYAGPAPLGVHLERAASGASEPGTTTLQLGDAPDPWRIHVKPLAGGNQGVIAAAAARRDFPDLAEQLLLTMAANQAGILLDRLNAEHRLRRNQADLEDFFENATIALHWVGPDGTILRANKAELDLLGYSAAEYVGHKIGEFHADSPVLTDIMARLERGEQLSHVPARLRRKDGSVRHVLISSSALKDDEGHFVHTRCFTVDVTERHEAEEERRRAAETLERRVAERTEELALANRRLIAEIVERERAQEALRQGQKMEAIGQLTGGIAHDFNNLLMAILGHAELLESDRSLEAARRRAASIRRSAERGARLARQLLTFARKQHLIVTAVDIEAAVGGMRDLLDHSIGRNIEVRYDFQDEPLVRADQQQIELAVLNLVINARDAMPDGGVITIATEARRIGDDSELPSGDYVAISVSDTGTGMPGNVVARVFEPFFTTKEVGKGTGLGLSMVHGLAAQLGGAATIDSQVGHGTKVTILLPRSDGTVPTVPTASDGTERSGAPRQSARVLVIDDDPEVLEAVAEGLAGLGYQVLEARGHEEALRAIERPPPPDLLLIDFTMPGMPGPEVARQLRAKLPSLPILFMTGHAEAPQFMHAAALGPVIQKPFRTQALEEAIRRLLWNAEEKS